MHDTCRRCYLSWESSIIDFFGGHIDEVTPVPIPNTEVKFVRADGSGGLSLMRVGRRRNIFTKSPDLLIRAFLFAENASSTALRSSILLRRTR